MALVLLDGSLAADIVASAGATLPYTAYAAWAAELGVSASTSLYALDDDDNAWPITLASAPILGGTTTTAGFGSEGGLGLYLTAPASTASTSMTLTDVSRMYMTATRPGALFVFHPDSDLRTEGVRLQRSGSTTIIKGLVRTYNSSTYTARFAIRMNGPSLRFIFEPVDQPLYFGLFKASSDSSVFSYTCSAGSLYEFVATVSNIPIASGFSDTQFGDAELLSRLALGTSETLFGTPSTPMLALSAAPTTVFGTAAQAHPAVGFVSTVISGPQITPSALGFKPTVFGTGSIPFSALGIAPSTAFGLAKQAHPVTGFSGSVFGSHEILPSALGFVGTAFGLGAGSRQFFSFPSLDKITKFGTPNCPYDQTLVTEAWARTVGWGRPLVFQVGQVLVDTSCTGTSVQPGAAGVPTYAGAITVTCAGSDLGFIAGTPRVSLKQQHTSSPADTTFGAASTNLDVDTTGTRGTQFGAPTSSRSQHASGAIHQARWGLATATRSTDFPASTLYAKARFGQPKGALVKGEHASGATTTAFGTHISAWRLRGLHIPPGTRLGTPRVTRTPSC